MFDMIKSLEDSKKKKAVDDPRVRHGDPKCWECLSDEQRDVINTWYMDRLIDREHEKDEEDGATIWAGIIGVSPFAFFQAISHCIKYDKPFWALLLGCVAALVIYGFIYTLATYFYREARKMSGPETRLGSFFFHAFALLISFFLTFCFFSRVT